MLNNKSTITCRSKYSLGVAHWSANPLAVCAIIIIIIIIILLLLLFIVFTQSL